MSSCKSRKAGEWLGRITIPRTAGEWLGRITIPRTAGEWLGSSTRLGQGAGPRTQPLSGKGGNTRSCGTPEQHQKCQHAECKKTPEGFAKKDFSTPHSAPKTPFQATVSQIEGGRKKVVHLPALYLKAKRDHVFSAP